MGVALYAPFLVCWFKCGDHMTSKKNIAFFNGVSLKFKEMNMKMLLQNVAHICLCFIGLTHCGLVTPYGTMSLVNIGWGNGLLPNGKPLLEPMMTNHQLGLLASEANFTRNVRSWWRHQMEGVFFARYWPFIRGIPLTKGQYYVSLIWVCICCQANSLMTGDLKLHDVYVMTSLWYICPWYEFENYLSNITVASLWGNFDGLILIVFRLGSATIAQRQKIRGKSGVGPLCRWLTRDPRYLPPLQSNHFIRATL